MKNPRLKLFALGVVVLASCSKDKPTSTESSTESLIELSAERLTAKTVADRYIVVFREGTVQVGVAGRAVQDVAAAIQRAHGGSIVHTYKHALHGFAIRMTPFVAEAMRNDSRVEYVEPDGVMSINDSEANATWGLDRLDQRRLPLNQTYLFPTQAGEGVHAYVIDTGIYAGHSEFSSSGGGSRVTPGYDFIDNDTNPDDCNGHGTHVAGTIAGSTWGVAKKASLHSVRVLDCNGNGSNSGVIAGIDWVTANHIGPAVANMSLGGGYSSAVNRAVTNSIAAGVTYAVAAGNSNGNACFYSPSSTPNAITVGATKNTDTRSSFSNYGSCVDIFAPGEDITSSWIGGAAATNTISGTSMATPHVVGSAALWLGLHPTATPSEVAQALTSRASPGLVQSPGSGSPNLLLYTASLASAGPAPQVAFLGVSPATIESGSAASGEILLTDVAPTGGVAVALASSAPGMVTAPASVLVPAGSQGATFSIVTVQVAGQTAVTLTATFPATVSVTGSLTLLPSPTAASLTLSPTSVQGGAPSTGTVTLSGPAPAGGADVTLASGNVAVATVPATVHVPEGGTSGTFTITTVEQSSDTTATISAAFRGQTRSAVLTVTRVLPVGNATFDSTLQVPRCLTVGASCDTGGTIDGRGPLGPETNAPNTISAACADGTWGTYHSDESLDRLKIATTDGTALAVGKTVQMEATVWSYDSSDSIDFYFAPDATNPVWTLIATLPTTVSQQAQVLTATFVLPSASLPAVRGNFRYQGFPGSCTAGGYDDRDDLVFAIAPSAPINTAPAAHAGPDQTITLPAAANLTGTATDDGLPNPPATVTTTWSVVSGTGTVTFADPSALGTTATFSAAGSYTLRLDANDGELSASDDLVVTVNPAPPVNQAPVVNAGEDQAITLPASANLAGTATDDGLPNPPATVTTTWSVVSGTGTVTFADPSALGTTATFSAAGSYTLRLTANDTALSASDDIVVAVSPAPPVNQVPVVNAGLDQTITLPTAANLSGAVSDDGLPNPPATVTATWSKLSGPGTVTFASASSLTTMATFSVAGSYTLVLTADDGALSASDSIVLTVNAAPVNTRPVVNAGADQTIILPAAASLSGTVSDDGLPNPPATVTTTWSKVSGPGTVTFASSSSRTTTATFSAAGTFTLRLTASDSALSATDNVVVTVKPVGTTACTGLCSNPAAFTISGTYQSGNLGTGAVCYQTTSAMTGGSCAGFVSPRTLKVNGTTKSCNGANWSSLPAKRNGGYCIQTTTGNQPWAHFSAF